ncbi:MAG: adenylosuccinate synthase [Phycisphaerae bacterium]|nr:adenylosuccinate synthase [Phycisphaerae bacterium]
MTHDPRREVREVLQSGTVGSRDFSNSTQPVAAACTAVVGLQWGDEGKGKIVDALAPTHDAVIRYNGGANAGHSVQVGGERYALHLVPSGILNPGKPAVIAGGVVVDPEALLKELDALSARGVDISGFVLSDRAHVVMPYHKDEDALRETMLKNAEGGEIGTTRRGIGPCYADKANRSSAIRVGDLIRPAVLRRKLVVIAPFKSAVLSAMGSGPRRYDPHQLAEQFERLGERLRPSITDTVYLLHDMVTNGSRLLFEGANATLLDVDHGTYPFVTASGCSVLGIPAGTGVPGVRIGDALGVMKAYSTRVGGGPFPTELQGDVAHRIRERGREYGTTTGRPRRVGWLDLVAVRYSAMINGVNALVVTLLDVLSGFEEIRVCTSYQTPSGETRRFLPDGDALKAVEPIYTTIAGFGEDLSTVRSERDLPPAARAYLALIEREVGVKVRYVGVGPDRQQTIALS